jgi:aspartate-semialdehyde dehydrogenase
VKAVAEMLDQARRILDDEEPPAPEIYPHRIAFNVLPQVETFKDGDDYTTEERKMIGETRKILGLPALRISATCARVPVRVGHS